MTDKPAHAFPHMGQYYASPGMELRDWFAGQALAGIMANNNVGPLNGAYDLNIIDRAYHLADQMVAQRSKKD